ncbi:MAG TPA: hypothetical protein VLB84_15795 [Bacteroidia bacterium]|nr:hypothetical protein [Bacteroidia bacterium]
MLVKLALSTRPPAVASIPEPEPVISPVEVILTPPTPTFKVEALVQFAVPASNNDWQFAAVLIITENPSQIMTSSEAVGVVKEGVPLQLSVDQVDAVPHEVFALE